MSLLDNLKFKNINKMKNIENYLEKEIIEILNKKNLNNNYQDQLNVKTGSLSDKISPMFSKKTNNSNLQSSNHVHNKLSENQSDVPLSQVQDLREEYLPFKQEEIKPASTHDNQLTSTKGVVEEILLEVLMPVIGEWLDENIERIVYKVVKNTVFKSKESVDYLQKEIARAQAENYLNTKKHYYNHKEDNYSHKSYSKKHLR